MNLSHKQLSAWYLQLGQMLEAGMPLGAAIEGCSGAPAPGRRTMVEALNAGRSVADMLDYAPDWLPQADRLFLKAASLSGQLPQTFVNLSERHKRIGSTQMKSFLACLYPLGILHFAILVHAILSQIDFQRGFQFHLPDFLFKLFLPLGVLWSVILLVAYLVKSGNPLIPFVMNFMPGLRGYRKGQRIADLAFALKSFIEAGLPIGESWAAAGAITGDRRVRRAAEAIREAVNRREAPSVHLKKLGCFPEDFIALYTSGERTGQLDSSLAMIGRRYQEKANTGLTLTMALYPALIFVAVALFVAAQVIGFYAGIFDQYNQYME